MAALASAEIDNLNSLVTCCADKRTQVVSEETGWATHMHLPDGVCVCRKTTFVSEVVVFGKRSVFRSGGGGVFCCFKDVFVFSLSSRLRSVLHIPGIEAADEETRRTEGGDETRRGEKRRDERICQLTDRERVCVCVCV
jgi:hypothetical protein